MNNRTCAFIQNHVMISLTGAEVEKHWVRRAQDPPADWEDRLKASDAPAISPPLDCWALRTWQTPGR